MRPGTSRNGRESCQTEKGGPTGLASLVGLALSVYRWKVTRLLLGALASVGLGWLALHKLDWGEVLHTFRDFPIEFAFLGALVFLGALLLRAFRWYVLFVQERVSLFRLFIVQNAGIGLNNMMPVRAFGEATQFLLLTRRDRVTAPTALATIVTVNVLDVFASALLMGLGVIFLPQLRGALLAGFIPMAIVSLLIAFVVIRKPDSLPLGMGKRIPFLARFADALATLRDHRRRVLASFVLTVGHWVLVGLSGWILARGLGIDVNLGVMIVLLVAVIFAVSAIPSLPWAVGIFEAGVIIPLSLFSVDEALAFSFAVVMHVMMFAPPTIIALIVLPREGVGLFTKRQPEQERAMVAAGQTSDTADR